jgi:hypothetical protein
MAVIEFSQEMTQNANKLVSNPPSLGLDGAPCKELTPHWAHQY